MSITLAFDIYGTLIDTQGVTTVLQGMIDDGAGAFSRRWREKQLEYSFRRGLMQNYVDFATCTRQALDYTCDELGHPLSQEQRDELMTCYRRLPAFPEVSAGLSRLQQAGHRMFAFSNGTVARVRELLEHAGIEDFFIDVISVDEIRSFKPAPAVYAHFLRASNTTGGSAWLVSGNPFDITGAISCGMHGAWVKRTPEALFDPWEITPTVTVSRIDELPDALAR